MPPEKERKVIAKHGRLAGAIDFLLRCNAKDPGEARQGRILAGILLTIMVAAVLAYIVFVALQGEALRSSVDLLAAAVLVPVLLDNRRGNVRRAAAVTLALVLLLINLFTVYTTVDLRSRLTSMYLWLVPIMLAGALLSFRAVLTCAVIGVVNVGLLYRFILIPMGEMEPGEATARLTNAAMILFVGALLTAIARYQTDRYQRELHARNDDLDRLNSQLESEVRARTHDLIVARDAALAASRVKSELLANVSHELRTPMNAVLGMTGVLLDTALTAEQRELATDAQRSGNHLLGVIDDILELSNLDVGAVTLEEAPFDPCACLSDAVEPFRSAAEKKGIVLSVRTSPDAPTAVLGDRARLHRVLVNLIGNAVKFTDKGEVIASLAAEPSEGDKVRLRCTISDTGIGIPTEHIAQLFKPFGQIDTSLSRRAGGTGLGLALCKRLLERMGGDIHVESEVGKGSRFTIEVELLRAEMRAKAREPHPSAPDSADRLSEGSMAGAENRASAIPAHDLSILLAEDNHMNQKVAKLLLKKLGYRADVVENGAQAVAAVEKKRYDVILMDVQMPEMDGIEATRRILSQIPEDRRPRIIAFTAHTLPKDKEQCFEAGMAGFIGKPPDLAILREELQRAAAHAA